ncbi:MAG: serine/threonine-protein kinase [Pseudomonadota bacterium]
MSDELTQLGKYRILGELGRGAMGVVYRGFDPLIEREVALKTLRADLLEGTEKATLLERFKKEAQAAGRLNHPGIVQVYEYGEDNSRVFIAMELIQGKELKAYLAEDIRFDLASIVRMMDELLDALGFAHKNGVVHRDVKPSNIVVLQNGRIKVTDFGIARLESSTLTQAGNVLGTPSYMSPEQFMAQRVDGRSDLFSTGVLLYELLTGEKPFVGNSFASIMHKVLKEQPIPPSELNITIPTLFDAVVAKALSKRPDERFQNAQAFAQALDAALAGRPMAPDASSDATMMVSGPAAAVPAPARDTGATVVVGGDAPTVAATRAQPAEGPDGYPDKTVTMSGLRPQVSDPMATVFAAPGASAQPDAGRNKKLIGIAAAVILLLGGGVMLLTGGQPGEAPAPAPAAAVEAKGFIRVETEPTGAVVLIDGGRFGGVSPSVMELPVGVHRLVVRKDGHHDLEANVEVVKDKEVPFQITLTPLQ